MNPDVEWRKWLEQSSWVYYLAPVKSYPLELSWSVRTVGDWVAAKRGSKRERDPAVAEKATVMGRKRRLPIQLYYVTALTCRRRVSLVVRRVFSFGLEAWKQLCKVFEPWVSSRFQWMLQAALPSTRTDRSVRENQ